MIEANTYSLYYTGLVQPQHLLQASKASIAANALSRADNARLSEFLLTELDAFNARARTYKQFAIQSGDRKTQTSTERLADYVKHIHEHAAQEIRSRFTQPEMTQDEAAEALFKMEVQPKLEKMPKSTTAEISL